MAVATTMISYGGFLGACGWYGAHTSGAMHSLYAGVGSGAPRLLHEANRACPHIKDPLTPGPGDYIAYEQLQHFEHGVGGGKSYGPPIVHARPARSPKECRNAPRLGSRRLSDGSLSAASTTFRPSTPTTSTMKK